MKTHGKDTKPCPPTYSWAQLILLTDPVGSMSRQMRHPIVHRSLVIVTCLRHS